MFLSPPLQGRARIATRVTAQIVTLIIGDGPMGSVYRAERSLSAHGPHEHLPDPSGLWILWHETGYRSHPVGDWIPCFGDLEEAAAAAVAHDERCRR